MVSALENKNGDQQPNATKLPGAGSPRESVTPQQPESTVPKVKPETPDSKPQAKSQVVPPVIKPTESSKSPPSPTASSETSVENKKPRSLPHAVLKPATEVVQQILKKDKSKELMNRGEINKLITYRLQGSRPEAWEEDISRNTLDAEPFHNVEPINERGPKAFNNSKRQQIIQNLLGEKSFDDLVANDTYPIPCADDREGYSPGNDGYYWMSGLEDYLKVMQVVKKYGVYPRSVFDFGCASGRVIRHFAAQTEIPEVWGSDINARHIRWLFEFMPPQVKPIFNHCIPTLPIRDNSIDVITAFSVFTHIDTFETCWLAELRRIMHDDGICYLTVHNEDTWNICRDEVENPDNRLVQSILKIDPDVINKIHEPLADTRTVYRFAQSGPYRAQVFHSNNYLRKVWGRFFSIEEILPCHHVRQSVLVLRKK